MKKTEKEKYVILERGNEDLAAFTASVEAQREEFKDRNLVINLLKEEELQMDQLLKFLPVSSRHREENNSFVIASKAVSIEELPEDLLLVPSLREAEDLIQMEEIERELGF